MRFMILVKGDKDTEAGVLPDEKQCRQCRRRQWA